MSKGKRKERRPRTSKLKPSHRTFTGLVAAFKKDIDRQMPDLKQDKAYMDDEVDPDFLLVVGWALGKGMTAQEAMMFANHVWNKEDII